MIVYSLQDVLCERRLAALLGPPTSGYGDGTVCEDFVGYYFSGRYIDGTLGSGYADGGVYFYGSGARDGGGDGTAGFRSDAHYVMDDYATETLTRGGFGYAAIEDQEVL